MPPRRVRNLVVVLGDQLDPDSAALNGFDPASDAVWMAEVAGEATHVWTHKARIAVFLAAMRHYRDALRGRGFTVHYRELDDPENAGTFAAEFARSVRALRPHRVVMTEAGEHRVKVAFEEQAKVLGVPLEVRTDRHFYSTTDDFRGHAAGRKQLRMEFFYREMRTTYGVLLDDGKPAGGAWNYDADNRGSFGKDGPGLFLPKPAAFPPDATTRAVLELVERRFPDHPGSLAQFDWPVTPEQARAALADFIQNRLASFGRYQDAIWAGEPYLYHSRLSAALNLKLLDPREVVGAAEAAYRAGAVPLAAAEGFIRQILGWREYVRGVYWLHMPGYLDRNALAATHPLPRLYWTGDTDMACLRDAIRQTLDHGYAHHIQRLMITGLFALLVGVDPKAVHEWYLAVYVDAVEWVELPNTLGMSQYADGGVMASKPYCASGKYLQRMSNHCRGCRYDPGEAVGETACPFTTLYWDFLARHRKVLAANPRAVMQVKNLDRLPPDRLAGIRRQADSLRVSLL
jgi:deoxyribodipyrimidine photolyase-related protein